MVRLLRDYGPWGLVVVLGFVVWRMAIYIQTIHSQHHDTVKNLLQDHNKEQKEETKQLVEAMMATSQSLHNMNEMLQNLMSRDR